MVITADDGIVFNPKQIRSFPCRRLIDDDALDQELLMLVGCAAGSITGSPLTIDDGQSL
jgi:hypothetical protein